MDWLALANVRQKQLAFWEFFCIKYKITRGKSYSFNSWNRGWTAIWNYWAILEVIPCTCYCILYSRSLDAQGVHHELHSENKIILVPPLSTELENSRLKIVKRNSFRTELHYIKRFNRVNKILKLNPFIDEQSILRVGSQLRHVSVSFEHKHPILPSKHPFMKMIILHERHFYIGVQTTLSAIRQRYWPTSARTIIRSIINKCVICFRNAPKLNTTVMINLSKARVNTICVRKMRSRLRRTLLV